MNDLPRQKLRELLDEHGRTLLHMQSMFGVMLRQRAPDCESEIKALVQVLQRGMAKEIDNLSPSANWDETVESMVQDLASHGDLSDQEARWAVDSWFWALNKFPQAVSSEPTPAAPEPKPWERPMEGMVAPPSRSVFASAGFWQLMLIVMASTLGGIKPPVELWFFPLDHFARRLNMEIGDLEKDMAGEPKGPKIVADEPKAPKPQRLGNDPFGVAHEEALVDAQRSVIQLVRELQGKPDFLAFAAFLAAVGGATGGLVGFIFGGGLVSPQKAYFSSSFARVGLGVMAAFQGAETGSWLGLMFQDTAAVFFAAAGISLVVCLIAGLIGRYLPVLFYCWLGLWITALVWGVSSFEQMVLKF